MKKIFTFVSSLLFFNFSSHALPKEVYLSIGGYDIQKTPWSTWLSFEPSSHSTEEFEIELWQKVQELLHCDEVTQKKHFSPEEEGFVKKASDYFVVFCSSENPEVWIRKKEPLEGVPLKFETTHMTHQEEDADQEEPVTHSHSVTLRKATSLKKAVTGDWSISLRELNKH
ncbi:MAG: hypothetical protein BGO07_01795 [Alphaproteobacteria bacterium 40-19]|nr:MAG: hypothetical protein BGO07_01795 [Alphaproteobacteria bacterium 40-19]